MAPGIVEAVSNDLALAVVTSTIRHLLAASLAAPEGPDGAQVTTLHPRRLQRAKGAPGLNVHLYAVAWNETLDRNRPPRADRPPAGPDAGPDSVALDLHYLITAHGDDALLEPQRLLARAARALAGTPVLPRGTVDELGDESPPVRLTATSLTLDEAAALWTALRMPSRPSLTCTASPVLL